MASDNEASCASDPNFAVICSFLECFGKSCGVVYPDIARLQEMLENTQEVPQQLIDLHIKLLRKTRKTVSPEKWERALVKFCHTYSNQDGWELERFGYKKARIAVKLRLLKVLLETQFDLNQKFKNEVNKLAAEELRVEPLGKDKSGLAYWCQLDEECNIRVYREDLDEENWELVAKDREGVVTLINTLSNGEAGAIPINEDSNSLEISEKPIIDTGQVTTSPSLEEDVVQENGVHVEGADEKELDKSEGEDFEDEQEQDDINDDNDEDELEEADDDVTNDDSSKQNTEEDDSQETIQNPLIESNSVETPPLISTNLSKTLNGKVGLSPEKQSVTSLEKENMPHETVISVASESKPVETHKAEDFTRTSCSKIDAEEPMPVKSIETPVITSPLKLVNVAELKQVFEEKPALPVTSISASLSIMKKHCNVEESTESVMKSLEKLSGKNNLTFSSTDMPTSHSKLSVKPIDQLAANLVRIQSEKLEKPSGAKSLEKIAENLARSGSILGGVLNGEDDRLPQDFCSRSQVEKANVLRGHRGMDLSTSPRGWESTNEQNRPVDFSGIDLSSRKFNKTMDLPPSGYRTQDFQHREMDLSTKKLNKPEVPNLAYDTRAVMMRNHAMIADLSKRQMPFSAYEMSSTAYHNAARIPGKEEHRLPNYTILPDPSKITALRMGNTTVKRPMEGDDAQQDMLKRLRADVIPIRGSMDNKRPMISTNWRDDIGEAIEEPVMMVQGEGSGSDCDAVNPGLGEAVEEPVIFFYGEGSGEECGTGNPGDDASTDNKESNESKSEADSATASLSPSKSLTEDSLMNEVSAGSIVSNITTVKLNRNYPQSSVNVKDNCQVVGSTQEKPKFKPTLGIQIIPKSAGGSVKRLSRWDVGKPEEKAECDSSIISNEGDISPKRNTYDYECHNKQESIASTNEDLHQDDTECEGSTSTIQDVKVGGNTVKVDNAVTHESNAELREEEPNIEDKHPTEQEESSTIQDSVQCDSSISLCQADTSEVLDSSMEATPKTHSTSDKGSIHDACDSDNITSYETGVSEKLDNECKPVAVSPPRFFFGPNCISYTSKPEASVSHPDRTVTTSVHSKPDTLQYECVSSSKPVDEMIISCKSDDFDVTQTNNNSLKVSSFTPGSNNALCDSDHKRDAEETDGPSNTWDQTISAKFSVEEQNYTIPKTEAGLCNSESKLETEESFRSNVSSDPISSSENATSDYVQSEKTEISDAIPQPHSTNDLITPVNKEESEDTKQESATIEPPVTACDLSVASTRHESAEGRCNEFNEFSATGEPKIEDTVEETIKISTASPEDETDCKSSDPLTFKDDAIKKDLATTASSCSSSLTQNSQSEVADIREFEGEGNFAQLNRIGASEFPGYQEVDSSAIQDVDQISDKYQPFKNSGADSPGESCDKQSDKNDNFSEFDGQEEQSMDTDNEKMKSLAGSDVDSMCVNYDKNSERTDALSDLGVQDEGSGDSEEIKEKTMVDSLTKDTVPHLNMETDFIDNSGVTSTESVEQCDKNPSAPTISSTNDACIQDTSSQESIEAQNVSKEADITSPVKNELPTYNIIPSTVPDTNAFTPSESDNTEPTNETSLPNLVQTANEYVDDASENRSSCNDQDSNEDMVIDDRLSESNESSKDPEDVGKVEEKLYSGESSVHDNNATDANHSLPESDITCKNEDSVNAFDVVPKAEEEKDEGCQNVEKESHSTTLESVVLKDNESSAEVVNDTIDKPNDIPEVEKKENQETQEAQETQKNQVEIVTSNNIDAADDLKTEEKATEETDGKTDQTGIAAEVSPELSSDNKQSLVANYDSGDSNDGSDDVFETDLVESNESNEDKSNTSENVDQSVVNNKEDANDNQEEPVSRSTNEHLPDQLENAVTDEEKAEVEAETNAKTNPETDDTDSLVNEEPKHKEPGVPKEAPAAEEYSCNNIEHDLNEKLIGPLNECKYKEDSEPPNALTVDSSERSNIAGLTKITGSSASSEISLESIDSQVNKKCVNIALVNNSLEVEEENEISVHAQEKLSSVLPAQNDDTAKTESVNEVEKLPDSKEDVERIDISNQIMNVLKSKEQHLKSVEEKLITNLENDSSFIRAKDETLVEEQIVQSFKKRKDICELGNKENKFDVNIHEECHVNKVSLEGIDTSTPSAPNVLPLKLDNISSDMEKPQICKDSIETNLDDSKPVENLHFTKLTEKSESLGLVDNYGKQIEPFNVICNAVEPYHKNMMPSVNDNLASFPMQEVAPEVGVVENDSRKETNKRLHDNIDLEDVPPLKSKPLCIEPNERPLENIDSSEVQLDKNFDTFQQVDTPLVKTPVADKVSDILETPLQKTDYTAPESDSITKEAQEKSDFESKEQESSEIQSVEVGLESDDSMGVDNESLFAPPAEEADPLGGSDDDTLKNLGDSLQDDPAAPKIGIRVKPVSELVYDGWKLDTTESPKISRKRRNSSHESNSEDASTKQEDDEDDITGGKRIKLQGKRTPDKQLRKSLEESRVISISSDEEAVKCSPDKEPENKDGSDDQDIVHLSTIERKTRGRPRGRRRRGCRGAGRQNRTKHSEFQSGQTSEASSVAPLDGTPSNDSSLSMTPSAQKRRKKRKMVLGLEIGRDIAPEVQSGLGQDETPVRQSRRIAQLKIKEEADRRRIEEETLCELKEKKDSAEKKKRKKPKPESEEEVVIKEIEKEKKSKKKRRKRKKKKMLAKFNEANPWQSSSGSSSDEENENDDDEDEEEEMESEGSLLFKSDHEFSPESDLEKDQESEPLRRARTAQKAQSDVEEAEDEYACQKCGKADHPEWILLCDSCDKGWHCSCLRPALMLIPEGDWFCPPCQHTVLVAKLRESLKTYDQLTKRHENEVLRKKRLAFVGISLDNVLHKGDAQRLQKGSKASSQESENDTTSSSSASSSESSSSDESEPVYQLRERRCASTYKFNEYDDMINAAIQDEVEAVQGAGNQGRGKDIATIVNAEKEEAQLQFQAEVLSMREMQEDKDNIERKSEKDSDEEYKIEGDDLMDDDEEEHKSVSKKLLARKKHRKLNSLDISSEDDPESDEDFKGTSSEEEEDFDDHLTSSDDSTFTDVKRRGKKGDSRPVRRSTRARMIRYDDDFINDDSEESDRPKRKKSRSMWGDSDSEDSDNSWRQRKKKSRTMPTTRCRTLPKIKSKKKKKRKRIIESDNQSENDEEDEPRIEEPIEAPPPLQSIEPTFHGVLDVKLDNNVNDENNGNENNSDVKDVKLEDLNTEIPTIPVVPQVEDMVVPQKPKKENTPKPKKVPTIRRKIIYGGLPDENLRQEEEETLGRRTRGRKINYQEEIATDSEEELKKALRKTGESEDEFVVNEGEDVNEDAEKDSDSGDIYNPKKDNPKFKSKSPKTRRPRKSKSPGGKRRTMSDGTPKQRKKPGPKPGSKNKARKEKFMMGSVIKTREDPLSDKDVMAHVIDHPMGELDSKIDDNLPDNVGLTGTTMSVASSFTGDVPEGSLTGLGPGELAELDDEQLEQMMMEDEEYGRRQLELAAIEIAKKKKKEEREAKKLEKARLKALEILAAERQRDPNAPEGADGEVPKKKKRGRRSKAEILAEQMRRDGAPNLTATVLPAATNLPPNVSPSINPGLSAIMTPDAERTGEGHIPMMTGPDGQLFNPDGSPMKPKRRGRGKGKKTLALEAARAAEAAAKAAAEAGLIGLGTDSNPEMKPSDVPNVLPTPGSSTSGSAPSTPPASAVTTQGPPSTQSSNSQAVYPSLPPNQQSSVITRMLQSQPVSSSPQSFTAAAAAMGHKYFGGPNAGGQMMGGPRTGYEMQPRGRIPSPYRQAGQTSMPPHFAAVRSGTPPMRMRVPGPQMYHTPHHPMDPSPSGGGPISINNRDRSSPLGPGPAMIPPAAGSPLAKGGPTPPPPPPPYVRGGPPLSRFADNPMGPRHQMPPFTNASPANHNMQQPSPPPNRPPGNFSPYHPPPPPNYHYGAYPPPPPMSTADDAAAYQGSPYPAEHFSSPADNQPPPIQAPPPPQPPPPQQAHPNDGGPGNKQYDEEGSGEFGGLVSYFSSQREDDLDS